MSTRMPNGIELGGSPLAGDEEYRAHYHSLYLTTYTNQYWREGAKSQHACPVTLDTSETSCQRSHSFPPPPPFNSLGFHLPRDKFFSPRLLCFPHPQRIRTGSYCPAGSPVSLRKKRKPRGNPGVYQLARPSCLSIIQLSGGVIITHSLNAPVFFFFASGYLAQKYLAVRYACLSLSCWPYYPAAWWLMR
ncbi:hypothetical protein B0I35DRAFT_204261 [Stachybotrys elegans]|uniref:Uncharacterized protein n=1 Tax=Stachybotrys elegans TaxID=80388 RepID=A0A8K0WS79_9HYPO|nr:hypothetical protein B0I35DRAFT_204261 [Stachybotrys elegans]